MQMDHRTTGPEECVLAEWGGIVYESPSIARLVAALERVVARSEPILLQGERGTGKTEIARAVHRLGPRSKGPFVAVNCATVPAQIAESLLFGHERGAFTGADQRRTGHFEEASGGTISSTRWESLTPPARRSCSP